MRRLLMLAAGVLAIGASSAHAATINVTVADDVIADDGRCSLREAVRSANLDVASFASAGECPAGDLEDTINVPPGTFNLSIPGEDDAALEGDLDLAGTITIVGAGAGSTTIDAKRIDRVFDVKGTAVKLQGLTITGGHAPDSPGTIDQHGNDGSGDSATAFNVSAAQDGGGIRSTGVLTILDSTIVDNEAGNGGKGGNATGGFGFTPSSGPTEGQAGGAAHGGNGGAGGDGGGIFSTGSLTLIRARVEGNKAGKGGAGGNALGGSGGGGFDDFGGSGGTATGGNGGRGGRSGGILQVSGVILTVQQSVISGNVAGTGGAGGSATGGYGNVGTGLSGQGGFAFGGNGGTGGDAGGIIVTKASISQTIFSGNHAGDGGSGGPATGGHSEPLLAGSTGSSGGDGGRAQGGDGGTAGDGGALWADEANATNVTFADNASGSGGTAGAGTGGAGGKGGSVGAAGDGGEGQGGDGGGGGGGGAILAVDSVTVAHATFTGNGLGVSRAGGTGTGGAPGSTGSPAGAAGTSLNGASSVSPQGSVVARVTNPVTVSSSIIAGNTTPGCTADVTGDADISFGDPSCPGANVDPLLGPLADNGGLTFTRRPGDGSPAIDGAPVAGCPATDQRGVARPSGVACDIGSYERSAPGVAITTAAPRVQGTVTPNGTTATYHFEYGTTTAYGSSTADASAGGVDPVVVSADLPGLAPSTTYHVRLVATNADGTGASSDATFTTGANPPGGDTTPPVILSASVKPKKFKRRHGTTFRYKLSEAAKVGFTIQRKKGKRYVKARKFSKTSKAGANKKKLVTRKLKPGRYRATLVATDAAKNRSKPKRLTFRIKR